MKDAYLKMSLVVSLGKKKVIVKKWNCLARFVT